MAGPSFQEAVEVSFNAIAMEVDGVDEKCISKPGLEGLHMLLDARRVEAPRSGVLADVVSVESLTKAFEDKGWPHDLSFNRQDLASLLESLCVPEAGEQDLSNAVPQLVDEIRVRAAASQFPLLRPIDLLKMDERGAAEQPRALVDKMDAVRVQSYIDYQKQK